MADSKYSWTGPEVDGKNTGLPFPTGDSPPKAPEQIQKLADSIAFYGTSRPDTDSQYDDAPTGSQYIFTGNQTQLNAVFGARVWRKGVTDWVCVEGDTGLRRPAPTWTGDGSYNELRCLPNEVRKDAASCKSSFLYQRRTGQTSTVVFVFYCSDIPIRKNHNHFIYFDADDPFLGCHRVQVGGTASSSQTQSGAGYNVPLSGATSPGVISFTVPEDVNASFYANVHASFFTTAPWPTNPPPIVTRESIMAEMESIKADPDQLQQLKDELKFLEGTE